MTRSKLDLSTLGAQRSPNSLVTRVLSHGRELVAQSYVSPASGGPPCASGAS